MEFLRGFKDVFVSVVEVSRRVGARRRFNLDRTWARPVLMRMELNGMVEANDYGEYRIKRSSQDTTFKEAVGRASPGMPLGETTIIHLSDITESDIESWEDLGKGQDTG